jgi:hypothetical protein
MGCHTWFYKLIDEQPTKEEKVRSFVERSLKFRGKLAEALKNGGFSYRDGLDWYPFEGKDEALEYLSDLDWKIENAPRYEDFKSDYESIDWNSGVPMTREQELYAAVEHYEPGDLMTIEVNGKYYENVPEFGDVFRYHEYGKVLASKEETYKLLESDACWKDDRTYERVDAFWERYPDGIIKLG